MRDYEPRHFYFSVKQRVKSKECFEVFSTIRFLNQVAVAVVIEESHQMAWGGGGTAEVPSRIFEFLVTSDKYFLPSLWAPK